jgi:hypothetical protein
VEAVKPIDQFKAEIGKAIRPAVVGEVTDGAVDEDALSSGQIDSGEVLGDEGAIVAGNCDHLGGADVRGEGHGGGVETSGLVVEIGIGVSSGVWAEGQRGEVDGGSISKAEDGLDVVGGITRPDGGGQSDGAGDVVEHNLAVGWRRKLAIS